MNSDLSITVRSTDELPEAAKLLLDFAGPSRIFLFNAPMGAGKTTLIKALCLTLGSQDDFSSPTYSIINEYSGPGGKIFHFDLYRLKNAEELLDLGIEEYLSSGNYCFVEWPSLMEGFPEETFVDITIRADENIRYIRATKKQK